MASVLDKKLMYYLTRLDETQKKSLLAMMKSFLKHDEEAVSIAQYNKELDEAMARIDSGDFTALEELEKEMQSW